MSLLLQNSVNPALRAFPIIFLLPELSLVPAASLSPAQILAADHKAYPSTLVLQTLYDSWTGKE